MDTQCVIVGAVIDGGALREWRRLKGWNAKPFAEAIGISPLYLSAIERGQRNLERNPNLIKRMADALGVPMESLVKLDKEAV